MEVEFKNGKILLTNKVMNALDEFVLQVSKILEKHVDYVIVSGYVAILFGRSRGTEDIDFVIKTLSKEEFLELYEDFLGNGFEFINSDDPHELYTMLRDGMAIRVSRTGEIFPNAELKFPKDEFHREALEMRILVDAGRLRVYISPLELQIAYKLYLGTDRDFEDAYFLYELFKDNLDMQKLKRWCTHLGVDPIEE